MTESKHIERWTSVSFEYTQKKAEKIGAAVYLITNLLSDRESLKWALRSRAIGLVSELFAAGKHFGRIHPRVKALTEEMLSLLEIASVARLVSEMNTSILKGAFSDLLKALEDSEPQDRLTEKFLEVPKSLIKDSDGEGSTKRTNFLSDNYDQRVSDIQKPAGNTSAADETAKRRRKILLLMQDIRSGTISDIARVASEVSEKTIQRDLGALVARGLLERRGRKRWVTYHAKHKP